MVDRITRSQRSVMMSRISKYDNRPERIARSELRRVGLRFVTYPSLPGSPDIVLRGPRIAVFVNGCFWHGCSKHYRPPKTRRGYWLPKIQQNRERDRVNTNKLRRRGWSVITLWECELNKNPSQVIARVVRRAKERLPPQMPGVAS